MYRAKRSVGLILGTALLVSVALGNGAAAQEAEAKRFELAPTRDSGVSGTATLEDTEGGVEVAVNVEGLEGGGEYVHHIHEGATCAEDQAGNGGPVEFPLNEVVADDEGTGSATSVVRGVTLAELLDGGKERYLNFHPKPPEGQPTPPGIACTTFSPAPSGGAPSEEGPEPAQETEAKRFELAPTRDSGVSGTATLEDTEGGVEVAVNVEGLEGGGEYVHHIHEGATCRDDNVGKGGAVEFPLNEVVADDEGTGSATSVVRGVTLAELLDGGKERYLNFHPKPPEGQPTPPGIACTTFSPAPSGGAPSEEEPEDLPESGGPRPAVVLLAGAGLILGSAVSAFVLRRRDA